MLHKPRNRKAACVESVQTLYTIGHSNHSIDKFIELLKRYNIDVLVDVRSIPYSRLHSQFNRENIKSNCMRNDIKYIFMGNELGARPNDTSVINNGAIQYNILISRPYFISGINRILKGVKNFRVALMCAEKDPINCHRFILISNFLKNYNICTKHILYNGQVEENSTTEERLVNSVGLNPTLFDNDINSDQRIVHAYNKRAEEIAFNVKEDINMQDYNFSKPVQLFTIGFTKKSAKMFFELLKKSGVKRVIDVRLNNKSQLAGFTRKDSLEYFLNVIDDIDYKHILHFAPTKDILSKYKKKIISWPEYERQFNTLLKERNAEKELTDSELDCSCFLCSEDKPQFCHRRLVAEYLRSINPKIEIIHL